MFAFLILLGVGCSVLLVRAATEPVDAGEDFMQLMADGNGAAAYDSLSPLCQTNDRAAFEQLIATANVDTFALDSLPALDTQSDTPKAIVGGTATIAGVPQSARLDMEEVDGDWRVCMFIIGDTVYAGR